MARPKVYWWWLNGYTDSVRIKEELRSMKAAGIGGVDIFEIGILPASDPGNIIPAGPAFMGDSSLKAIQVAVEEAGKLDMEVGLGLASSWNAGGSWVQPQHAAKTVYYSRTAYSGSPTETFTVPFPEITPARNKQPRLIEYGANGKPAYWEDIAVLAVPKIRKSLADTSEVINVTAFFNSETDQLSWEAPQGDWDIYRFICSNSGEQLARPSPNSNGPIIDHFDSTATEMHINYFIDRLQPVLGDLSKTALKYFYLASYEAKDFAWTATLPATFRKLHGYPIDKFLPAVFDPDFFDKEVTAQFNYDFLKTFSELMIHNHYRKAREICNRHGLQIISEAGGPGHSHHIPAETLKALGSLDIPRGEFWYNRTFFKEDSIVDYIWLVKEIAAASHIYKLGIVEEEAFTSYWDWQEGPADLKIIADRAFAEGMNRLVIHGFTHNPSEFGVPGIVYWAGTHYNDKRVWWPKVKPFNDYLSRISYILQNTSFHADVLYYYGDDIPNLVPPKNTLFKVGDGYDYEIVNTEILLKALTVEDGYWVLPGVGRYKVLSLGKGHRSNPEALARIRELEAKGGVLAGDNILEALQLPPDFSYSTMAAGELDYIHYTATDSDFYLVRNTTGETVSRVCSFRQSDKTPEIWDPATGKTVPVIIWEQQDRHVQLPVTLAPYETLFVVFSQTGSLPHADQLQFTGSHPPHLSYTPQGIVFHQDDDYQLKKGTEIISLKHAATRATLTDPWQVTFNQGATQVTEFPQLTSWTTSTDPVIRYYSGIASYSTDFEFRIAADKSVVLLDLGEVAEVADVWLNEQHLGISWSKPHRFDISSVVKEGANTLRIEVANTWSNRLTGDAITGERFTQTNLVKANKNLVPWNELPLKTSGLLGPVTVTSTTPLSF